VHDSGPMRALGCFVALVLLVPGCEVSVFGSDPIVIIGDHTGSEGGHACTEPDDARRARDEMPDSCAEHCRIDAVAGTTNCDEISLSADRPSLATLDMSGDDGVLMTFEICQPTGYVLQIGDSSTTLPDGGDGGSSSHNADLSLEGTTVHLRAATSSSVDPSTVESFLPAEECSTRTIIVSDQIAFLLESRRGLCGTGMLRINPPTDELGSPDSLWYVSLAGSLDGSRPGSGVRSVELCFW
jgi:hypothetical protein